MPGNKHQNTISVCFGVKEGQLTPTWFLFFCKCVIHFENLNNFRNQNFLKLQDFWFCRNWVDFEFNYKLPGIIFSSKQYHFFLWLDIIPRKNNNNSSLMTKLKFWVKQKSHIWLQIYSRLSRCSTARGFNTGLVTVGSTKVKTHKFV